MNHRDAESLWFNSSELEPKLALEHTATGLLSDLAPRDCCARGQVRIDRQVWIRGLRMVQDVKRVEPELQALGFGHFERFRKVRIESSKNIKA